MMRAELAYFFKPFPPYESDQPTAEQIFEDAEEIWEDTGGEPISEDGVLTGTYGDKYQLTENNNGEIALIDECGQIVTPWYQNAIDFFAVDTDDDGHDEIFVTDPHPDPMLYHPALRSYFRHPITPEQQCLGNDAWRDLQPFSFTYDIDYLSGREGCHGDDYPFGPGEQATISVVGDMLVVGYEDVRTIITPTVRVHQKIDESPGDQDFFERTYRNSLSSSPDDGDLLSCAIATADDPTIATRLRSALRLYQGAAAVLDDERGPYQFSPLNIQFKYEADGHSNWITATCGGASGGVHIVLDDGWHAVRAEINSAGTLYRLQKSDEFGGEKNGFLYPFSEEQRQLVSRALRVHLPKVTDAATYTTIENIIAILDNPPTPAWAQWGTK